MDFNLGSEEYAPFIRKDQYGIDGLDPQTLPNKIRLAFLCLTVLPLKLFTSFLCILAYYLTCRTADFIIPKRFRTAYVAFWGKVWCRMALFCVGFFRIKWVKVGPKDAAPQHFGGYVSNHSSWIDIIVHMAKHFPSFVARQGTEKMPLIGIISQKMQCLYVDRDVKGQGVSSLVKEKMLRRYSDPKSSEHPMLLFPEGTTTNNKYLLPFKTGAFLAGVPVLPVIMEYGLAGRVVPTWDSLSGPQHIFLVMTEPQFSLTCYELPVYVPSKEEQSDPILYARNVREYMLKHSKMKSTDSTYDVKKRMYGDIAAWRAKENAKNVKRVVVHAQAS